MFNKLFEKRDNTSSSEKGWQNVFSEDEDNSSSVNRFSDMYYCRCLNALGDTVAKIPINVKKDTKDGRITDYNFYLNTVLDRMSEYFTTFETIKYLIMQLKDNGKAGLYIVRNGGMVNKLLPVKINDITVDDTGLLKNSLGKVLVDFTLGNVTSSCLSKDIIILRDNTIKDVFKGSSIQKYTKNITSTNVKANNYQSTLFSSGMSPKLAIQCTSDIQNEDELRKIKRKFEKRLNGEAIEDQDGNKIFLIPAGFSVTPLNLKLADSQFAELKLQGKQDICNALGVPMALADGTITEEQMNIYYNNIIQPLICQVEQEMTYKLLTEEQRKQGYKIRFNMQAVLKTSLEKQMQILTGYVKGGILNTNEARAILGYPNIEGGDVITLPSGQVSLNQIADGNTSYLQNTKENIDTTNDKDKESQSQDKNDDMKGGDDEDGTE